jgi:predicted Co/Zn/Cd cation transporter (cation efflux family)
MPHRFIAKMVSIPEQAARGIVRPVKIDIARKIPNHGGAMEKDYEKAGLKLSLVGSILFTGSALVLALMAKSQAILLDGLYTFVTLIMSFISLKVVDLVKKPESPRFPFGFTALEPFINLVKSLVMLLMLSVFLVTNIKDLLRGGREISLDLTIIYIFICLVIYAVIIGLLLRCGKHSKSSILSFEIKNWCIDALMTLGIAISLVGALIALRLGHTQILPYIDPSIVIVLVLLSLPVPLKYFFTELRQVLLVSPENVTEAQVRECLAGVRKKHGIRDMQIWGLKSGRVQYLFLYCDLEQEEHTITELDKIRLEIFDELEKLYDFFWADIMFTRINPCLPIKSR